MGITQSMGRSGSALDNAAIESWHSTLTFELLDLEHFTTRAQAPCRVAAWIDEYNRDRRHSALGMRPRSASNSTSSGWTIPPRRACRRPRRRQGQALRVAYRQP
jgi:transposase InsO family protein